MSQPSQSIVTGQRSAAPVVGIAASGTFIRRLFAISLMAASAVLPTGTAFAQGPASYSIPANPVFYRTVKVDGIDIFYREAGDPKNPTVLLLHGFPSSSSQYRDLIPLLADKYHVVAPDYPGFGHSAQPGRDLYKYTFDHLYETVDHFTNAVGIKRFVLYAHDYGAPVGLRFALHQPDRIRAIIIQNGNAYEVGFTPLWAPIKALWASDTPETRKVVSGFLTKDGIQFEHADGAPIERVNPDAVVLDQFVLERPGNRDLQLDLFADYKSNVALYPEFHAAFRKHRFPMLIVWGQNDSSFGVAGAKAFRDDLPDAELHLIEAGHFASETHAGEIAGYIREFLPRVLDTKPVAARVRPADRTSTSPEGIIRTLLEQHEDSDGNVFELILDTFPAGIEVPVHHHPVVGLNYVLSGTAESQYEGEPLITLQAGDSFLDHANVPHLRFRNPDQTAPVKILISRVRKKAQSFFILDPK